MKIRSGLVSLLPLLFLVSPALLGRPTPEVPLLFKVLPNVPIPFDDDPSIIRAQQVVIDVDFKAALSDSKKLRLPLFGGIVLNLTMQNRIVAEDNSVTRSGIIDGQPASVVVFSADNEVLIANLATQLTRDKDAEYYEIRHLGGRHVLRRIEPANLPEESDLKLPKLQVSSPGGQTCTDDGTLIDVAVVYTQDAKNKAGGSKEIVKAIRDSIEEANVSYANSHIVQRLQLVGTEEMTKYAESSTAEDDLVDLIKGSPGLERAHALREETGADLVALIVKRAEATSCGASLPMTNPDDSSFAETAFAVVPYRCLKAGKWSLAHELGHLMGARHDFYVVVNEPLPQEPYPYSRGYVYVSKSDSDPKPYFRTLMAKPDECTAAHRGCRRVLYWSNPGVSYEGTNILMGKAETDPKEPSDNAKTFSKTAKTVANFRCSKP